MSKLTTHVFLTCFLFIFIIINNVTATEYNPDKQPLLNFKALTDKLNKLANWNSTTNPCTYTGVTCTHNRVTKLILENFNLQGPIIPLTELTQLRVLSLKHNNLSGALPDLSNLTSLKFLFLSHNNFSGSFPASVVSLTRLYRLDLSFNDFSGEFPVGLTRLSKLLTLRFEMNRFNGSIPELGLQGLRDFNSSGNFLTGSIPESLSGFPKSAFVHNAGLCGAPLEKCTTIEPNPTKPGVGSGPAVAPPLVSSSPSDIPEGSGNSSSAHSKGGKISPVVLVVIIVGDVLVLAVISLLIFCFFWRNYSGKPNGSKLVESEKIVYSSSPYPGQQGDRGQMVFFERVKRFELEDLLRASAEMLGKGGFGTAYKAVLDDGNVVAVKRLKDANVGGKREFEQHMEVLGRLNHQNVVGLKAYYFAREEKLLVYEYMPNGSLFWLLHGNRGPGRTPLDWTTRLKIAAGAARGLSFIHNSCKSLRLIHGNIKSTNVLLDKSGNACVSDFGLAVFAPPVTSTTARSNGYRAPETIDGRKLTQKSDVYSFGVLLLELLTGKCPNIVDGNASSGFGGAVDLPRWVQSVVREEWTAEVFDLELMRYKDIEEEMVGLLQIAMACTSASPDQRPKISQVVKMIEDIRGVEVSPCHDDSVSESPSISEDTCGAS